MESANIILRIFDGCHAERNEASIIYPVKLKDASLRSAGHHTVFVISLE